MRQLHNSQRDICHRAFWPSSPHSHTGIGCFGAMLHFSFSYSHSPSSSPSSSSSSSPSSCSSSSSSITTIHHNQQRSPLPVFYHHCGRREVNAIMSSTTSVNESNYFNYGTINNIFHNLPHSNSNSNSSSSIALFIL